MPIRGLLVTIACTLSAASAKAEPNKTRTVSMHAESATCARLLAEVSTDGRIVKGSKEALIRAIRSGEPLRVGWALDWDNDKKTDIVHWVDAGFLSLFEGEAFAQIQSIHRQKPVPGQSRVVLSDQLQHWYGLIGTNGVLEGRMSNAKTPTRFRVRSWWCGPPSDRR
ncbi:MAG: hypothetical protein AAFV29_17045 [Myxococcota bacterium]